jgi:hypothetical protein
LKFYFGGGISLFFWFPVDVSISSITFDVIEIDDYPSSSPNEQICCFVFSTIVCATNINFFSNKGSSWLYPNLVLTNPCPFDL